MWLQCVGGLKEMGFECGFEDMEGFYVSGGWLAEFQSCWKFCSPWCWGGQRAPWDGWRRRIWINRQERRVEENGQIWRGVAWLGASGGWGWCDGTRGSWWWYERQSLGPAGVYGGTFRGGQRGESCSFDTGADEAVDKVRGMRELSQSGVSWCFVGCFKYAVQMTLLMWDRSDRVLQTHMEE